MKVIKYFLYTLLLVGLFASCKPSVNGYKKPFIIISKYEYGNLSTFNDTIYCKYKYQDINGNAVEFFEKSHMYKIGDTIK